MNPSDTENQFQVSKPIAQAMGALATSDQQRAIAEVQAALMIARANPRDEIRAMDSILNAFTRPTLAEQSQYQYSKGGSDVSGPSIRSAEAIAQLWGNMQFGFRELSRGVNADGIGYSEIEAFAWDVQSNTKRPTQFRVPHWRDTKRGGYAIKEEREIYELCANMAQRRVRACILAVIPGDVIEQAMRQADSTLTAKITITPDLITSLIEAFDKFGVSKAQIEKRIQRHMEAIVPAQVASLKKIHVSLRDGMSSPEDWFDAVGSEAAGGPKAKAKAEPPAAETKKEAPPAPTEKASDDTPIKPASEAQIKFIRTKAAAAEISEADIFKKFGIAALEDINIKQVDEILQFIANPMGD